ncbi:PAS domain-containing protein [Azospirillum halopraeferens]|uniref:PAS domain-containing protein n=1 Tax=Azospirillum halopraeferens TaxID=34010 RepID=UPI00040E6A47|nr:PAS domain-containing protein [Azospirillum halopraeferens]
MSVPADPPFSVLRAPATGGGANASDFGRFRFVVLVLVGLVIAGLTTLAAVDVLRGREQAQADAERQVQNLANTLEVHARGAFGTAELALAALAEAVRPFLRDGEVGDPAAVAAMVRRTQSQTSVIRVLGVADAGGRVRADGTETAAGIGLDVADRPYFAVHRDDPGSGVRISPPLLSRVGQGWFVAVSRRLEDDTGTFAGVVWAAIDLNYFEAFYSTLDIGREGTVTLWSRDGTALVRYPRDEGLLSDPVRYAAQVSAVVGGAPARTLVGPSAIDGRMRILGIRAVAGFPLAVAVRMGAEDYLAPWRAATAQRLMALAGVVTLVIGLTVVLLRFLGRLEATAGALQESERRARAIFDSAFQFIGLLTPDGRVLSMNHAAAAFAGVEPESLIGRAVWDLPHWRRNPDGAERLRRAVADAGGGAFTRFEVEARMPGGLCTLDISIKPVRDERGRVVQLISEARDITERKRMEDSLRRSEARLRSYLDAAMEGIFVVDGAGRFAEANPAARRMLGLAPDGPAAAGPADVVPAGHPMAAATAEAFAAVASDGRLRREVVLRHTCGDVLLCELSAVRLEGGGWLGVFRDVTARRRGEEALRASRARLRALIGALPDLAYIIDSDGLYREVLATGAAGDPADPAEPMVGRTLDEVLPADVAARILAVIRRTLDTGRPQVVEYCLNHGDGGLWYEGRTAVLPADVAPRPEVLFLARDVTDRVLAARSLARARDEAESASRAKSAFLATMSHELRTPLNAIIGFSEIMMHEVFGPIGNPRYGEYAGHIRVSGTHLLDLINDVLDMSKLEAGRYALDERPLDPAAVLESGLAVSAVPAERGRVALHLDLPDRLPRLLADERAVRQVLLNLLSNAVKFTPAGGRVTLGAAVAPDGGLAVTVADTGIGIGAEALRHVTEPFQQADASITRRFGGTGLGLAISRNLMELHGGRLTIASTPGEGTTVTMHFPPDRVMAEGVA